MLVKREIGYQILGFNPCVFAVPGQLWWVNSEDGMTFRTPNQGTAGFYSVAV
jgi:hypothetical protein